MNRTEAIEIVRKTFSKSFDELQFHKFIKNLLNDYKIIDKTVQGEYIRHAFHEFVASYKIHCEYTDPEGKQIHILQIVLKQESTLHRARTAQRNFVADYLKTRSLDSALVAFIAPNEEDWRFSLVKLEYSIHSDKGKIKTEETLTPAKRWSFLVGKNEGSQTVQSRFANLLTDSEKPTLAELEKTFDVEKVTNEFFEKYKDLFFRFKENLDQIIITDQSLRADFQNKDINSVDFAKKTLGQIVFLYFLQKKGWFGVAHDKNWGDGPKQFIRALFEKRKTYGENFFNDLLEPLFYEALATDRGSKSIYPRLNNTRMPFLNGGLFEPINDYNWEVTKIYIPDELFSNSNKTKESDTGDGILDVFDRYNFTVNENDPLEKEVAVDPEMLGKVFENLLEIKERKDKGSFYTPREIVHYMCRESLINYLENETNQEIPHEDLETLVYKGISIIENDSLVLEKIRAKEKKGYSYSGLLKLMLPKSIQDHAEKLETLLKNIKIADPAVGSGAFPLGMITEIVSARKTLGIYTGSKESAYDIKLHAISNSIHGVDIDPGAVEISKLRLWLSLVVEEVEPHPLPNLDHRIMQGNSLLSEYEGIKLFDPSFLNQIDDSEEKLQEIEEQISKLQQEYFKLHQNRTLDSIKKNDIERKIKNLQKQQYELKHEEPKSQKNRSLFDKDERYELVQEKTKLLQKKIELYVSESRKTHKEDLKHEIDELKWELIEESLKEQGKLEKLTEVKELRHKNIKPFFLWELEFSEVFKNKGGFDVVIGNPPYISAWEMEKQDPLIRTLIKKEFSKYYFLTGHWDMYIAFLARANDILVRNGVLSYIVPNPILREKYAKNAREYLLKELGLQNILEFNDVNVFENVARRTVVFLCNLGRSNDNVYIYKNRDEDIIFSVEINKNLWLNSNNNRIQTNYNPQINQLIDKIKTQSYVVEDFFYVNYGVQPSSKVKGDFKKADVVGKEKKGNTKPFIEGRDIKRFVPPTPRLYLDYRYEDIYGARDPKLFEQPKIIIRKISDRGHKLAITMDFNHLYTDDGNVLIVPIESIKNTSLTYKKINSHIENKIDLKYLFAILASKLEQFYFINVFATESLQGQTSHTYPTSVKNLVFKDVSISGQQRFVTKVDEILNITCKEDSDLGKSLLLINEIEKEIDQMVYELYGLTDEEIKIVEENTTG